MTATKAAHAALVQRLETLTDGLSVLQHRAMLPAEQVAARMDALEAGLADIRMQRLPAPNAISPDPVPGMAKAGSQQSQAAQRAAAPTAWMASPGGSDVGEGLLPFVETVRSRLAAHEQQLDSLQASSTPQADAYLARGTCTHGRACVLPGMSLQARIHRLCSPPPAGAAACARGRRRAAQPGVRAAKPDRSTADRLHSVQRPRQTWHSGF